MKKIIDQIDEKIGAVLAGLEGEFTVGDFIAAFREKNTTDWQRLEERLTVEEKGAAFREWKKGSTPTPEKYLANALKEFTKKNGKTVSKISNDRFKKIP